MICLLFAVIFNVLCFCLTYVMMPDISPLAFLSMVILVPVIYNVLIYSKTNKIFNNNIFTIITLTGMTTLSYVLFGVITSMSGAMRLFAQRNAYSDGNISITINENCNSLSNVIFVVLIQLCAMFVVKHMQSRSEKYDICE